MRKDGTIVYNEDPMYYLIPYFLTKRYDAMNMITLDIPEEPMRVYMNAKRKAGQPVSHLALMLTAYLRTAEKYPAINRFIVGKKIYQHNDVTVSIDENRQLGEANALDRFMPKLIRMNWLLGIVIGALRAMDRLGLLPKSLIDLSPFHASLLISNLASIRTNHIYHHVYQFGTTSVSITMGNMREVPRRSRDGIVFDRCMPLGVVMDERIANGHYLAQAFAEMKKLLAHPELMESPAVEAREPLAAEV